jgi:hypothetical protein
VTRLLCKSLDDRSELGEAAWDAREANDHLHLGTKTISSLT